MTIEQAIINAIEGGYPKERTLSPYKTELYGGSMFLDPSFWQSLGEAIGWQAGAWGEPKDPTPLSEGLAKLYWDLSGHLPGVWQDGRNRRERMETSLLRKSRWMAIPLAPLHR
jgi:hypothetical protein